MTAPAADPDLVTATAVFVGSQAAARDVIAGNVLARLTRLWEPAVLDDPRWIDRFAEQALQTVQAGQRQTADLTSAYLRLQIDRAPDAATVDPVAVQLAPSLRVTGDPSGPFRRPFGQWRNDLTRGSTDQVARDRAYRRLMVMADSDLTAAMREGARQTVADHRDLGPMRRIIRPELSRSGTCGLCIAAADRVYNRRTLMPIHTRCNCETSITTRTQDAGLELNRQDFRLLYGDAGGTETAALARTRFVISEHGEHGPVLRRAGDSFRGPGDVAAA